VTAPSTLSARLRAATATLKAAGLPSPAFEARALVSGVLGLSREEMLARPERSVAPEEEAHLDAALARRAAGEPLARITGEREFWSLPLRLGPDTLVPRPETETVVEAVLDHLDDRNAAYSILDLGTGSGCILLALLSELPGAWGLGLDRAEGCLAVAADNARRLGFSDRTRFAAGDWSRGLAGTFDIIVANPPYIARGEKAALPVEVRDFDPDFALFGGADGLDAYRALAPDFARLLAPGGVGVVELGAGQDEAVAAIFKDSGLFVGSPRCDLAGHARALPFAAGPEGLERGKSKKKVGNRAVPV
jgi:release factor glutamine methyltransferase